VYIAGPSGTPASPTIIRAYPADAVTITGASVSSGQVTIVNTSHITFDGFIITNFNQGLFVDILCASCQALAKAQNDTD
jgi:hypothetical protein